jgi:hypothetical protein
MAYTYNNIQLDCIDSSGTVLYNIDTFTAATIPTVPIEGFAIGNKIRLTLTITSSGGDNFLNKFLRFNPGLFVINNSLNAFTFGYETMNPLSMTAQQVFLNFASPFLDNIFCSMVKSAAPHDTATIVFEFYITQDILDYLSTSLSAQNTKRFISSRGQGLDFINLYQSVYSTLTRNIGIVCKVFDYSGFDATPLTPTGNKFLRLPVAARWYNSDTGGTTTGMRFIRELTITSPSQIAAGLGSLTSVTATAAQAIQSASAIGIFTVNNNQLAVGESNTVTVKLRGDSFVGSVNNPPITDVRVLLFRVDNATNTADFVTDLSLSDALIPQATPGSGQLNGAIYSPSDWFENVPLADDIEVQFTINGNLLGLNGQYYIVVNIHDSVNPDEATSHISPLLNANYVAPVIPTITGYLSTYNQEYTGNDLSVAPHQRIKARIEIDKTSYTGFDTAIAGIICKLTNITGVVNQVQLYLPNGITSNDMTIITDNATDLVLDCIFRIAEEYAGQNTTIEWTLSFNQPVSNGLTQFVQINYEQRLSVDIFENDNLTPNLLNIRFYDLADYLVGIKTEIIDICSANQIIAEVEKDPTFTGSINLIATIYPASETGNTNTAAIEEEEDWQPIILQMSQSVSGKLDNVETGFLGDDFATFRINVQQLTQGQRYWVTAIAFEQFPDYCPLGIAAPTSASTTWNISKFPGWTFTGNVTNLVNAIIAHPDYVTGVNISDFRLVDSGNNLVGTSQIIAGNLLNVIQIDTNFTEVYYTFSVDAIFDSGSGNHLIRHTYFGIISRPPFGSTIGSFITGYVCTDLG